MQQAPPASILVRVQASHGTGAHLLLGVRQPLVALLQQLVGVSRGQRLHDSQASLRRCHRLRMPPGLAIHLCAVQRTNIESWAQQ